MICVKDKICQKKKVQEKQVAVYKEAIPMKQATKFIDLSKTYEQKSPVNKTLEELSPEKDELSPEEDQVPHCSSEKNTEPWW